jgi:uncharacterized membrane protein YphA (DoxX/SURF4 family)
MPGGQFSRFSFIRFPTALIFHPYWAVSDPAAARTEANSFFGHLSMMGGMLFVVAFGAGDQAEEPRVVPSAPSHRWLSAQPADGR